jgi:hypothetical protein
MADGPMRPMSPTRYRASGGYKQQEDAHMGSIVGHTNTTLAAAPTRDDLNDGLRQRLAGLSLPAPLAVVSELRQLVLSRLDPPAANPGRRKRSR